MMHAMRVDDAAEIRAAREVPHREAPMHEPVMNDDIRDAERRHAEPCREDDLAERARSGAASVENGGYRNWRVKEREGVVPFKATPSRLVVGAVHAPERAVPDAAVQKSRPQVHRHEDDQAGDQPEGELLEPRRRGHGHLRVERSTEVA